MRDKDIKTKLEKMITNFFNMMNDMTLGKVFGMNGKNLFLSIYFKPYFVFFFPFRD
jgi:hypothetical protein